jgi:hypothetical protein
MNLDAKQKKFLVIGGLFILGVYLVGRWLHNLPKPQPADLQSDNLDRDKLLSKGSEGAEVAELQRVLKKDYNAELGTTGVNSDGIDGDFGIITQVALKKAKGVEEISLNEL